jgi:hypothetical protein
MKTTKFLAAAVVFVATGAAFAADAPLANAAVTAAAATAAAASTADKLNLPAATVGKSSAVARETVKSEAAQFVQNHKTTLAVQLEQYKN